MPQIIIIVVVVVNVLFLIKKTGCLKIHAHYISKICDKAYIKFLGFSIS